MKLPRSFPTNKQLMASIVAAIVTAWIEVYFYRYVKQMPSLVTFRSPPVLSEKMDSLSFKLRMSPKYMQFNVVGYGVSAKQNVKDFCEGRRCVIPLVIGGEVNFTLIGKSKILFSEHYKLPPLGISCDSDDWETRKCQGHNICFNSGMFTVTSPYPLEFDHKFMTVGARVPPVDVGSTRVIGAMKYQYQMPQGAPYLRNRSNYMSISQNMNNQWHLFFDFIVPVFLTVSKNGVIDRNRNFFFWNPWATSVPHIVSALSDNKWQLLHRPFCFEDLEMGMFKIMKKSDQKEPFYALPDVPIEELQQSVFNFFRIDKKQSHRGPRILIIKRESSPTLLNADEVGKSLSKMIPDSEYEIADFSQITLKDQINKTQSADVLVGMHERELANMLFMEKNKIVIELMPYGFDCCDWYEKAAKFSHLRHISYHARSKEESRVEDANDLNSCWNGQYECDSPFCFDKLKQQNLHVNITEFEKQISPMFV